MKQELVRYMQRYASMSEEEAQVIVADIQVEEFKQGSVLLQQGEVPTHCYFVLKGCVRQYSIDEGGREVTSNFYTEEQAIAIFNHHKDDKASPYTFICVEDSILVVGEMEEEKAMYDKHKPLEGITRTIMEENMGKSQEEWAAFIASSPEERFRYMLHKRPGLIDRVPQHQLASYLGMTPESLSRIKKRVRDEQGVQ
ncbi:Crp/Fnr family transcriptional regulator [Paenibacillus sp. J5C_2022]|uniref:Crp/Fnr family transcriptional regulator n=1 Tax=Paenibacillus sp. J5C2022 TaxID=2977129 RepID=UPI0021D24DE3|nr:Crp/Fnr family transcriptional regulator [Paenibacillus sp. J5C2022]MCU6712074.1 Crp/Fnr family transcriptional regulator [Paenibacillus sp. J5C2022]